MKVTLAQTLIDRLRRARSVAVLTGAGVSAESGIPTFRDAQTGLWARYDPHDLATPEAFERNPRLVWEWYEHRRALVAAAAPNPAHLALAELERRYANFTLITQNVDGLHRRAGSRNVVELHGDITRTKCFGEERAIESWPASAEAPPPCPHCGGPLRPDVVWFGESLPPDAWQQAVDAARTSDVFLCIGTSGVVHPAAALPHHAQAGGALDGLLDTHLYGLAGQLLLALVTMLDTFTEAR